MYRYCSQVMHDNWACIAARVYIHSMLAANGGSGDRNLDRIKYAREPHRSLSRYSTPRFIAHRSASGDGDHANAVSRNHINAPEPVAMWSLLDSSRRARMAYYLRDLWHTRERTRAAFRWIMKREITRRISFRHHCERLESARNQGKLKIIDVQSMHFCDFVIRSWLLLLKFFLSYQHNWILRKYNQKLICV